MAIAWSISGAVVNRPNPNRREAWAKASERPKAFKTGEGKLFWEEQAEPEASATWGWRANSKLVFFHGDINRKQTLD